MPIPPWYKRKPYLHFDLPLNEKDAIDLAINPNKVKSHAFYPFIGYTLTTPRTRRDAQTGQHYKEPKKRKIAYPAHQDGYIFSYYKFLLEIKYERWLKDNHLEASVTAFRKTGESTTTLAKKAFDFIRENPGCQVIATDVEGFFDHVDHRELKNIWARFIKEKRLPDDHYAVFKALTRYCLVERHRIYNLFGIRISGRTNRSNSLYRICSPKQFRERVLPRNLLKQGCGREKGIGIPQGSSLSPLLSNMYMADLDSAMHSWATFLGGNYWRYCDDILVVLPEGCDVDILAYLDWWLKRLKLSRSPAKTQIRDSQDLASKQLQYLDFLFNGSKVMIRSSSIHRYQRKVKKAVQAAKFRQMRESQEKAHQAPFRKQAIFNKYSELPPRGKKLKAQKRRQKYRGNFTHYMTKSANKMESSTIRRQRRRLLKQLRERISQHS